MNERERETGERESDRGRERERGMKGEVEGERYEKKDKQGGGMEEGKES